MSREVVYWLMSVKAQGVSFLAYDDGSKIAMLQIDDALYEVDYPSIETCYDSTPERLGQRLKQLGRLISGLAVKSPDAELSASSIPDEAQVDRRCG